MGERSYPSPKVRDSNREHQAATAQERLRVVTPCPRSGAVTKRSSPTSREQRLRRCRRAERSYSTFKVRRGNLVQGKEQWLRFAGAAVKRYPTFKIRETQVRR